MEQRWIGTKVEQVSRIDKKFAPIGFVKVQDDKYGVCYEREDKTYKFTQVLYIGHKKSGRHIIQSYDKDSRDTKGIGNTCVGLSYYETKLALKKMKKKGWGKCMKQ